MGKVFKRREAETQREGKCEGGAEQNLYCLPSQFRDRQFDAMPIARKGKFLHATELGPELMLRLESSTLDECIAEVAKRQIPGVTGMPWFGFSEQHLNFLKALPHLRQIWFSDVTLTNVDGIYSLPNLTYFHLHGKRPPIDFSRMPSIESLSFDWHANDSGIHTLQHTTKCYFWHHKPRTKSFCDVEFPPNLEWLEIIWSNSFSLDGLPHLPHLKHLEFHRFPNLRSLEGVDVLFPNVEKLIITTCGRLEDISASKRLQKLSFMSPVPTEKARKRNANAKAGRRI